MGSFKHRARILCEVALFAEEEDSSIVPLHGRLSDLLFRLRPAASLWHRALCLRLLGRSGCVRVHVAALVEGAHVESDSLHLVP